MATDTFSNVRARMLSRFLPPIPTSLTVHHRGCGGEVRERQTWEYDEHGYSQGIPHRLQCEKAEYDSSSANPNYHRRGGCGGVWLVAELDVATEDQLSSWFTCSDNDTYKIAIVDPRKDPWNPRAYHALTKK